MRRKIKDIALGFFMAVVGLAAFFQMVPFDHLWKYFTISLVGMVSIIAAMIFLVFSGDRQ